MAQYVTLSNNLKHYNSCSWCDIKMPLQQIDSLSQWEMFATAINIACLIIMISGPWFNIKMSPYQYRKSHCGDKTILRPSYLHNGISHTGKKTYLYWISLPWSPLNISYMNWDQVCSWSRALTQNAILIPSHLLSCACKTVIQVYLSPFCFADHNSKCVNITNVTLEFCMWRQYRILICCPQEFFYIFLSYISVHKLDTEQNYAPGGPHVGSMNLAIRANRVCSWNRALEGCLGTFYSDVNDMI